MRACVAGWIAKRRERGLDWKSDESRLKHHVLPQLGDLPLAEVRARHVVDLFHKLRTDRERDLAPRTFYNICTVVAALFRDAKLADLIEQSPCILDERPLGPLVDRIPGGATQQHPGERNLGQVEAGDAPAQREQLATARPGRCRIAELDVLAPLLTTAVAAIGGRPRSGRIHGYSDNVRRQAARRLRSGGRSRLRSVA